MSSGPRNLEGTARYLLAFLEIAINQESVDEAFVDLEGKGLDD